MNLRPLGHRLLIQPDTQETESASGLLLPENRDHVPVSGTVVAVGSGPVRDQRIRAACISRCISIVDELAEMGVREPHDYRVELERYRNDVERFPGSLAVGMRVVYPQEVGLAITYEGQDYVEMNEDDVVIVVPEEAAA